MNYKYLVFIGSDLTHPHSRLMGRLRTTSTGQ